ncbi:MAG TPA: cellulase family glycosylhydrolase [Capillimicrobium sp.]|nr:cellulase family glycosylhydrolase [Capillimicrobium sp.]
MPRRSAVALASTLLAGALATSSTPAVAGVVDRAPLSTSGARIVDRHGDPLVIQGVNWFGFETHDHVPHGLWARDYRDMLAQIRRLGFNAIRLPFSLEMLQASSFSSVDFGGGRNAALQGRTPLQAMDEIIAEARRQDLLVVLDNHSTADDAFTSDLWYGNGYSEDDWVAAWRMLARRYADRPNVVAADLKNEPHGAATWGTGGATDWRRAAERAGDAIGAIAPHWLIVVEGVEGPVAGQLLDRHWWGGNLEGVRQAPVRLALPHKLVYSPHEYGPGVFPQPWFSSADLAGALEDRWEKGFDYIARQGIAPILVGEFGGRSTSTDTVEGRWQRLFADFLARRGHSWTYWAWNPNSGDTGGVLRDDWTTTDAGKVAMLQALMRGEPAGGGDPEPDPDPDPDPEPGPEPQPAGPLTAEAIVDDRWPGGACAHLRVRNGGATTATNLRLRFRLPAGTALAGSWNGTFTRGGEAVDVALPAWAQTLAPGATYESTGFCLSGDGTPGEAQALADGVTSPPPPGDAPPADPDPQPQPQPPAAFTARAVVQSQWDGGYCAGIAVTNTGTTPARPARLTFSLDGRAAITQSWSGTVARSGEQVAVTLPDWAGPLAPGASATTFGFCASTALQPREVAASG